MTKRFIKKIDNVICIYSVQTEVYIFKTSFKNRYKVHTCLLGDRLYVDFITKESVYAIYRIKL